jgi:hypothetical protein
VDPTPTDRDVTSYYQAALLGLRHLEAARPTGRRFGLDAEARWSAFKGDLTTADRIDLMIRDANAQWPEAFGARTVFAEPGVAEDEPFGASWPHLDDVDAETLWRSQLETPPLLDLQPLLAAVAAAWGFQLAGFDPGPIDPADQLVIAGPSAIAAALLVFHRGGRDLDWSDQALVIATPPGHRQLAALGGAMLGTDRATNLLTATQRTSRTGRLLVSPDATPADLARAHELAR